MSRAAYMREYRRRKKGEPAIVGEYRAAIAAATTNEEKARVEVDIGAHMRALQYALELEQEVARLKRELAARPTHTTLSESPLIGTSTNTAYVPAFRPVPKPTRRHK